MGKSRDVINMLKRIWRFGPYIPLSSVALAVCGSILPDKVISGIHRKRNAKIQRLLKAQRKKNETQGTEKPAVIVTEVLAEGYAHRPQPIWVMWMQGEDEMPRLVRVCLSSIRANSGEHPVVVLDRHNYRQYVTLNPKVEQLHNEGTLKAAHFADILRVNVLAQQGGLWLDATIMLTAPLGEEVWERPFFTIKTSERGHFVSRCRWSVFCMGGKKGLSLFREMADMFNRYLSRETMIMDYFMLDHIINLLYDEKAHIRRLIDSLPQTNPKLYRLNEILTTDYSEDEYEALTADTSIFKLNRKAYSDEALAANPGSYFAFLEKKYGRKL